MRDLLNAGSSRRTGLRGTGLGGLFLAAAAGAVLVLWQRSSAGAESSPDRDRPQGDQPDDDLTRISGIGPALAARLRDNGVTRFSQIAAWDEGDIAAYDAKLKFAGRIERDGWVRQAKSLQAS